MNYGTAFTNDLAIFIEAHPPTFENPAAKKIPSVEWQMVNASRATIALKGFDRSFYTTNANFLSDFTDGAAMHFYSRHGDNMVIPHALLQTIGQRGEVFAMINALSHSAPTTGTLSITAGKLTYTSRQTAGTGDDHNAGKRPNEKLLAAIPAGTKLLGMASLRIDIGIVLAMAGKQGKVHDAYTRLDFDTAVYQRAFDGHLLVLCLEPDKAMVAATGTAAPVLIGMAAIGDRSAFDKLTNRLDALHIVYTEKAGLAFFGKNRDQLQAFASAARTDSSSLTQDSFLAAAAAFTFIPSVYADVLSRATPVDDKAAASINAMINVWRPFDELTFATGQIENGRSITSVQLTLSDRSKNPLLALLQLAKAGLKSLPASQ